MGLFDDLIISPIHLPEKYRELDLHFQTKSLEPYQNLVIIDEEGNLLKQVYDFGEKTNTTSYLKYTGDVIFYTGTGIMDDKGKEEWLEFSSYFVKGKLLSINRIDETNSMF